MVTNEIYVLPVLLGRDIRLYYDRPPNDWLTLASSRMFADGVVELIYRPALVQSGPTG